MKGIFILGVSGFLMGSKRVLGFFKVVWDKKFKERICVDDLVSNILGNIG